MRGLTILALMSGTLAHAAMNDYVEVRDLVLDADDIEVLNIDTGSGPLVVAGVPGADRIEVSATITVPGADEDEALEVLERDLRLSLAQNGSEALLESHIETRMFSWGDSPGIELEVRVPQRLSVTVDDGSGSIRIDDVGGSIRVDDGSGSLSIIGAGGAVAIDDGSGSIRVEGAGGDVKIIDGSGSISVRRVAGSVYIDDGSGSIDVDDVLLDLVIEESGSGSVDYSNVQGRVVLDE
jgi:hypothetical protein